ncbi:MAG: hypothetical protein GXP22_09160 [Gammaproteobacteria bacterium]|nr:hypothetical protein [Gammaproteobacteria bacterium]
MRQIKQTAFTDWLYSTVLLGVKDNQGMKFIKDRYIPIKPLLKKAS